MNFLSCFKIIRYNSHVTKRQKTSRTETEKTECETKTELRKEKQNAKRQKQKSFFIGNIFLNSGKSKNVRSLWSD
ncbi:hypothetical protein D0T87_02275 [Bacteroides sp. 51]|nr:hypothetical protein [Bacteroides sp. 51]